MNFNVGITPYSNDPSRILFESFDAEEDKTPDGKVGVRCYTNKIAIFILKNFFSGMIEEFPTGDNVYCVNKSSLDKWKGRWKEAMPQEKRTDNISVQDIIKWHKTNKLNNSLNSRLNEIENQINKLDINADEKVKLDEIENEIKKLDSEVENLIKLGATSEKEEITKKLKKLKENIINYKVDKLISNKSLEIESVNQEINKLNNEIEDLNKKIDEINEDIGKFESANKILSKIILTKEDKENLKKMNFDSKEKKGTKSIVNINLKKLKEDLDNINKELKEKEENLKTKDQELNKINEELKVGVRKIREEKSLPKERLEQVDEEKIPSPSTEIKEEVKTQQSAFLSKIKSKSQNIHKLMSKLFEKFDLNFIKEFKFDENSGNFTLKLNKHGKLWISPGTDDQKKLMPDGLIYLFGAKKAFSKEIVVEGNINGDTIEFIKGFEAYFNYQIPGEMPFIGGKKGKGGTAEIQKIEIDQGNTVGITISPNGFLSAAGKQKIDLEMAACIESFAQGKNPGDDHVKFIETKN